MISWLIYDELISIHTTVPRIKFYGYMVQIMQNKIDLVYSDDDTWYMVSLLTEKL